MAGVERFELPDDGVRGLIKKPKQPKIADFTLIFRFQLKPKKPKIQTEPKA